MPSITQIAKEILNIGKNIKKKSKVSNNWLITSIKKLTAITLKDIFVIIFILSFIAFIPFGFIRTCFLVIVKCGYNKAYDISGGKHIFGKPKRYKAPIVVND